MSNQQVSAFAKHFYHPDQTRLAAAAAAAAADVLVVSPSRFAPRCERAAVPPTPCRHALFQVFVDGG